MRSFATIESCVLQHIEQQGLSGVVIAIANDGNLLYEQAFGHRQTFMLDKNRAAPGDDYLTMVSRGKIPLPSPPLLTTDTLFDLASLTKVLATTMATMLLVYQGKLQLDQRVQDFLPEFRQPDKSPITLRHLLSHSSGMAPWKPLYYHANCPEQALTYISQLPLAYPVDSQRLYSDLGMITLRFVIEKASQLPLEAFLQQQLYQKLHLQHTLFNPDHQQPIAATSHGNPFEYKMVADDQFGFPCDEHLEDFTGWRDDTLCGEVNDGNAWHVFQGSSGHAGLFSTAGDVSTLMQFMLGDGRAHDTQIVRRETLAEFTTKNKHQHGLGWAMTSAGANADLPIGELLDDPFFAGAFGHTGFTGTFVLAAPASKTSIVILTNMQNAGVNAEGRYMKMDDFFQKITALAAEEIKRLQYSPPSESHQPSKSLAF